MFIKDIILDGFKIYENKTIIRNLSKSYNAITGLNGSGKSNIIDGIIFTLGLESGKLLRTNTLKELINVNRKECKVTLVLSNTDKSKSPEGYKDYNEIIISRSIDNLGKTKFYLNNHSCSYSTINKLCSSMNINSEKGEFFFIIMQGHITKVLNMKSKEIGTLIEETAGTRSYTKEKEKAILALEKKERKLIEVRDTLQRRISPFYSRLREEREAFVEQRNLDQIKEQVTLEKKEIKQKILTDEISKNVINLRNIVEQYIKDKNELTNLESKLMELQDIECEESLINIKELLEDEKLKLEELRKTDPTNKLEKYKIELDKLVVPTKKTNLDELKERESFLLKNIKNEAVLGGKDFSIIEELENLKIKKTELEFNYQNMKDLKIEEINNKISNIEKYKVDYESLANDKKRLNYLKMKLIYPIRNDIYGTVDENITLTNDKYKEAVFTIMGSKSKHVIVSDEKIGSELLNTSDRRISVIPLNKIKSKFVDKNFIRKVKESKGKHMIDLITFDDKLRKAMEHVFNGYFVFEDSEMAKKMCYDLKIMCITLDGNVYDPKGTLTGGKSSYKIEITSKKEIQELQCKIEKAEQNYEYFTKCQEEYELLKIKKSKCLQKEKLVEELKSIEIKIKTITEFESCTADFRSELTEVRNKIIESIKEENIHKDLVNRKDEYIKNIKDLEIKKKENEESQEDCINKILKIQDKLGELEIKTSNKRLSERQIKGLEPKQKYLIRSTSKLRNRITKVYAELVESLKGQEEKDSDFISSINTTWLETYTEGENQKIFESLNIDDKVFNFKEQELDESEHKILLDRLSEIDLILEKCSSKNTVRMDPQNFDLLEKNEMIIESLKEKIQQLEEDKSNIMGSIENFNLLGIKENEKAFKHLNEKVGKFLRYFLKDSDVKIEKSGASEYELKVKVGNWKDSLTELSGGQRSLVALCLIFSILTYRPAPFYIFDEIDSALDLSYTQSIGEIIKHEFRKSQFIIISLKNGMYESADNVYKVFLKDGKSNICQIK
ncbi:structural maintenance of chromosomes protein 2 (SMC2) [Vairimorpha necatrix]|uniref:Structural maintenance of chromosomes protein 2 (SMC2) n=1 Tax=Vairimorpha necatrix TaxID=6039 RepID=A0AAX4J9Z3_9MICR